MLRDRAGHLWAGIEDFALWRLPMPRGAALIDKGIGYYPLAGLPGITYHIDEDAQSVSIWAPAGLFAETVIGDHRSVAAKPDFARPGGFFNYDVVVAHASGNLTEAATTASGVFEIGAFNRWGTGTSTFVRPDPVETSDLIRLDSTWTQDRPDSLASLRFGDSISGISSWGGAVHFGGVQWSTDFSTQPGFVTTPLAAIHGEAVLPSTLDLYVDNALRLHTAVPPGPFSINDLPLSSGEGEAHVVLRNLLGQQETISVPYYASPLLLRPGLSSFSYEVGAARDDYGLASNDYGRGLAVATHRYGFSDDFTGELHLEMLHTQQTAGVGGVYLLKGLGVFNLEVAGSHSGRGDGDLLQFGFQRQWAGFSLGGSARYTGASYIELGMLPTDVSPVRVLQETIAVPMPRRGSLSVNYIQEDYRTQTPVHLLSAEANWPVGGRGFISIAALKPLRAGNGSSVQLIFTQAFGARTNASVSVTEQRGGAEQQAQLQQNLPAGTGYGYRLNATAGAEDQLDASLQYQNTVGTYALQAARYQDQTNVSVEAVGGVALLNKQFFLSRKIDQSFAVVQVGDFPNVHIYADNQEVAETDAGGSAIVPRIRAYERNPLRIEQADLPLDVDLDVVQLDAVPYRRSGVLVNFDVHRTFGALLSLIASDGAVIPVGAVARVDGGETEFPVGTQGETYVTGLGEASMVRVAWPGRACEVRVAFTPSADPLPKLGPLVCEPVAP